MKSLILLLSLALPTLLQASEPIRGIWLTEAASIALDSNKGINYAVTLCS